MKSIIKFVFFKVKKKLSIGLHSFGGRNFLGRVCVYHKGGGNKFKYKLIDRYRRLDQSSYIYKIFKQSSFTAFIGMVIYDNGLFSVINSVELFPFSGSKLARSAGSSAYIIKKDKNKVFLKLKSGWQIKIST